MTAAPLIQTVLLGGPLDGAVLVWSDRPPEALHTIVCRAEGHYRPDGQGSVLSGDMYATYRWTQATNR